MFVLTVCIIILIGWLFSIEDANANNNASMNETKQERDLEEQKQRSEEANQSAGQVKVANYIRSWADEVEEDLFGSMESTSGEETEDEERGLKVATHHDQLTVTDYLGSWADEVEDELFRAEDNTSSKASAEDENLILITTKSTEAEESHLVQGNEPELSVLRYFPTGVSRSYVGYASISSFFVFAPSPLRNVTKVLSAPRKEEDDSIAAQVNQYMQDCGVLTRDNLRDNGVVTEDRLEEALDGVITRKNLRENGVLTGNRLEEALQDAVSSESLPAHLEAVFFFVELASQRYIQYLYFLNLLYV
ncbi:hypothetical protein DFH27DRAFT_527522 [Peziza echinospora]|nr:hypothetical protein DFH27DRAFT_527522 [Peziza echinospora]